MLIFNNLKFNELKNCLMDFGEFRRKKHSQSMSESESKHLHVERIYSDYVQTKTVEGTSFLNATIKTQLQLRNQAQ